MALRGIARFVAPLRNTKSVGDVADNTDGNGQRIRQMAEIIGIEARALGVTQLFAPMSDLIRDMRYGRVSIRRCGQENKKKD